MLKYIEITVQSINIPKRFRRYFLIFSFDRDTNHFLVASLADLTTVKTNTRNGGWVPTSGSNQWLELDFGQRVKITSIVTLGLNGASKWVTQYRLWYYDPQSPNQQVFAHQNDKNDISHLIFHV